MDDKDLDKLFNGKLGGFKEEPDSYVRKNIVLELDGRKRRNKHWQMMLMAVVTVFVLAGLMLLLLKK